MKYCLLMCVRKKRRTCNTNCLGKNICPHGSPGVREALVSQISHRQELSKNENNVLKKKMTFRGAAPPGYSLGMVPLRGIHV